MRYAFSECRSDSILLFTSENIFWNLFFASNLRDRSIEGAGKVCKFAEVLVALPEKNSLLLLSVLRGLYPV